MKVRKVRPIIWQLFHRKKERFSSKAFRKLLDIHLKMHEDMIAGERADVMTIEGKDYEAAVEKFEETMIAPYQIPSAPEDSFSTAKTGVHDIVSVVRVSEVPGLLLLLGVRIKG